MPAKKLKKGGGQGDLQPTQSELEYKRYRSEQLFRTIRTIWRGGVVAFGLWMFRDVATAYAGKVTLAEIRGIGELLVDVTFDRWVAYTVTAVAVALLGRERKLRKTTIERLSGRIIDLEKGSDPTRTSSNLTKRGDTHPRDVI